MVRIPGGTFDQGCTPAQGELCFSNEEPAAAITLTRDFLMSATEVTQEQFKALVGTEPSRFPGVGQPVEALTWHKAAQFANALSALEGLPACYACDEERTPVRCEGLPDRSIYDCEGYRLPTEAEWEHAARCGRDTRYAGADELLLAGWYSGNSGDQPRQVGWKDPNDCGLYDLSGNVWEWTNDLYNAEAYRHRPTTDPEGGQQGKLRVKRGGSWKDSPSFCRLTMRLPEDEDARSHDLGFRVVRSLP
jgi:formylglycine-generating enzyme required for sulfatase activity